MSDNLLLTLLAVAWWALILGGLALLADWLQANEHGLRNRYDN